MNQEKKAKEEILKEKKEASVLSKENEERWKNAADKLISHSEVLVYIFTFLNVRTLTRNVARVCKQWYQIFNDWMVWRAVVQ